MNEIRNNDFVPQMLRRAMPDDIPEAIEQRLCNRLAAFRERFDTESPVAKFKRSYSLSMGGLTMRQRVGVAAFGGVGVAAFVAILVLWGGLDARPVSAMEKMAEAMRRVKSYKCTQVVEEPELRTEFLKSGEPTPRMESVWTIYWLAPGSSRLECSTSPRTWKGTGPERTQIRTAGKPGIIVNHEYKVFFRTAVLNEGFGFLGCETLDELAKFSGDADRELGNKEIDGKKARGFRIDQKKIHADSMPGTRDIWIDAETNLPVLVRYDMKWPDGSDHVLTIKDIEYDIDLDPELFNATPPDGYKDTTAKPLAVEEQVRRITEALKICAEVFGGRYPATHGDLVRALFGEVKAKLLSSSSTTEEPVKTAETPEMLQRKVAIGLAEVTSILAYNPDAAYFGKTVTPNDKDAVLFRWKLDDGRYQVIFGDLHGETVTAETLRSLKRQ
jgi:outer membrane lipoprotein-sorting protein